MEKKKLVLFHGNLNTINLFSSQLKEGFLNLGYEILEFDLEDIAVSLGRLYQFMQNGPVTAAIAFNCPFFGLTVSSGANVWEQLQIPCINILVDHPFWYHTMLMDSPNTSILLCVDRNHMNYVQRFYPNIPTTGFLPHGGTTMKGLPTLISQREISVLYAGSLYSDYIISQKPDFSRWDFPAEDICNKTISDLISNPQRTIETVLAYNLKNHGIAMSDQDFRLFLSSCVYIERSVSSYFRERILSLIAKAGIPLKLYGGGWEQCDWFNLPNVDYGGMITPEEVLEEMEHSKIVLNTLPWFKDGSHERVFNGMLRGCVVFSETSAYLEETLPDNTWESFSLTPEELSVIPKRINNLLEDEARAQEIANAGYQLAMKEHTWQARAEELHRDLLTHL